MIISTAAAIAPAMAASKIIAYSFFSSSRYGNEFYQRNFNIQSDRLVETLHHFGNCIAASIPLGLEKLLHSNSSMNEKTVVVLGTGAGLTLGGMSLRFNSLANA
ncbi:MAG: hypothetical protein RJA00_1625 [Bacteroidota bacterium]|jgi:3-oxoacyl-[acyl-carrier-protein] synthase III